jgi:hypothetical protein
MPYLSAVAEPTAQEDALCLPSEAASRKRAFCCSPEVPMPAIVFFSNASLLAPNALRYFKRLPRKIFVQRFWVFPLATCTLRLTGNERWRRIGWKNVCKLWLQERTPEQLKGEGDH